MKDSAKELNNKCQPPYNYFIPPYNMYQFLIFSEITKKYIYLDMYNIYNDFIQSQKALNFAWVYKVLGFNQFYFETLLIP